MFQTDLFRTATFRLTLAVVVAMIGGMVLQFSLIFVQLTHFDARRDVATLQHSAAVLARETPDELENDVRERSKPDLRVFLSGAALFDAQFRFVEGDIRSWPQGLRADGHVHELLFRTDDAVPFPMRFLAERMPDGRILVLARSLRLLDELHAMTKRAMLFSIVPVVAFALATGVVLSHRALARVKTLHEAIDRIMEGDLHERLPCGRKSDDLERLSASVNRMLDRLEHLLDEIRNVGNDIAHDLRTPLARVRARLERAVSQPHDEEALRAIISRSTQDLDQCFAVITALLRIGEIENGRRRAAFGRVEVCPLVDDIVDLYEPIAEAKGITFRSEMIGAAGQLVVTGDRDLLIEVLANLVDNAIKFTPSGGEVVIRAQTRFIDAGTRETILSVADTGIGIPAQERASVMGRFYRCEKSRHVPGNGLGLSLVGAILQLHDARLTISATHERAEAPGALFEIHFTVPVDGETEGVDAGFSGSSEAAPQQVLV